MKSLKKTIGAYVNAQKHKAGGQRGVGPEAKHGRALLEIRAPKSPWVSLGWQTSCQFTVDTV